MFKLNFNNMAILKTLLLNLTSYVTTQQLEWIVQQIEDLKKETRRMSAVVLRMTASTQSQKSNLYSGKGATLRKMKTFKMQCSTFIPLFIHFSTSAMFHAHFIFSSKCRNYFPVFFDGYDQIQTDPL